MISVPMYLYKCRKKESNFLGTGSFILVLSTSVSSVEKYFERWKFVACILFLPFLIALRRHNLLEGGWKQDIEQR